MNASAAPHPSLDTLHAFGNGRLDERSVQEVLAHLESCVECSNKVASLPPDSWSS